MRFVDSFLSNCWSQGYNAADVGYYKPVKLLALAYYCISEEVAKIRESCITETDFFFPFITSGKLLEGPDP